MILPAGLTNGRHSVLSEKASSPFPEVENERFSPSPTGSNDESQSAAAGRPELLEVEQPVQSRSATFDISQAENVTPALLSERQGEMPVKEDVDEWRMEEMKASAIPADVENKENVEEGCDHQVSRSSSASDADGLNEEVHFESRTISSEVSSSITKQTVSHNVRSAVKTSDLNVISPTPTQTVSTPESRTEQSDDHASHLSVPAMGVIGTLGGGAVALGYALTRRPGSSGNDSGMSQSQASPNDSQTGTNCEDGDSDGDEESGNWFTRARDEVKGIFAGENEQEDDKSATGSQHSGANSSPIQVNEEHEESKGWLSSAKDEIKGALFGDGDKEMQGQSHAAVSQRTDPEGLEDSGLGVANSTPQDFSETDRLESSSNKNRSEVNDASTVRKVEQHNADLGTDDDYRTEEIPRDRDEGSGNWFTKACDEVKGYFAQEDNASQERKASSDEKVHEGIEDGCETLGNSQDGGLKAQPDNGEKSESWLSKARDELSDVFTGRRGEKDNDASEERDNTDEDGDREEESGNWVTRARDEIKDVFVQDGNRSLKDQAGELDKHVNQTNGGGDPDNGLEKANGAMPTDTKKESEGWLAKARNEIKDVFTGRRDEEDNTGFGQRATLRENNTREEESENRSLRARGEVEDIFAQDDSASLKQHSSRDEEPDEELKDEKNSSGSSQGSGLRASRSMPQPDTEEEKSESWLSKARDEIKDVFTGRRDEENGAIISQASSDKEDIEDENSGNWFTRARDEIKGVFSQDDSTSLEGYAGRDKRPDDESKGDKSDNSQSLGASAGISQSETEEEKSESWLNKARAEIKDVFTGKRDEQNNSGVGKRTSPNGEATTGSWYTKARDETNGVFVLDDNNPPDHRSKSVDTTEGEENEEKSGKWLSKAKNEENGIFGDDRQQQRQISTPGSNGADSGSRHATPEARDHETVEESWLGRAHDEAKGVFVTNGQAKETADSTSQQEDNNGDEEAEQSGSWFSRARDEMKSVFKRDDKNDPSTAPEVEDRNSGKNDGAQPGNQEEEEQSGSWFSRARNELKNNFQELKKDVKDTFTISSTSGRE